MDIVPHDKFDYATCKKLHAASDAQIKPYLPELLEWLQDMNWPVAAKVLSRIQSMDADLTDPVRKILTGTDSIWKYWILVSLLPQTHKSVVIALTPELQNLAANATKDEQAEEVDVEARKLLANLTK